MTTPTAQHPIPPAGPYDPMFGLQEKIASLLTPIFHDADTDELFAYQVACRSLQAYEPETRADFVNAGRTIAFSLASLVVLKEAFNPALQLEDKKRVAIHANALNRSADQAERSMMERRRYQRAFTTLPAPQETEQPTETPAAEAVAPEPAPQPKPQKPAINPPKPISAIPKRPDPLIAPAMIHAVAQNRPILQRT